MPVDLTLVGVGGVLPGGEFGVEGVQVTDAAVEALASQRCVSRFLRQVVQGFIESTGDSCCMSVSSGLLIQTAGGRAGGSGCLRTNRSGLRV